MFLALETATDRASVAVGRTEADAVEENVTGARRHASSLLPMIDSALRRAGASLRDVTAIVVSDGPGSFTGLRVGAAVAKALVHARALPLWSAPSLMVRALGAGGQGGLVVAVSDALRGDVYAAGYRLIEDSIVTVLVPAVCRPEELASRLPAPAIVVGDVPAAAREALERWSGRPVVGSPGGAPRAATLLGLAGRGGGARLVADPSGWEPVYGRPAEAQARWETTHGRPLPDRPAAPADARALLALERRAFTDPWSEASFHEALASAWTFGLVAETGRGMVGYMIGREVAGTGEVLNLAVAPEFRRRGIAGALLEPGSSRSRRRGRRGLSGGARVEPYRAGALPWTGFRPVGQRAAYYRNPKEDALVLRLALAQPA